MIGLMGQMEVNKFRLQVKRYVKEKAQKVKFAVNLNPFNNSKNQFVYFVFFVKKVHSTLRVCEKKREITYF